MDKRRSIDHLDFDLHCQSCEQDTHDAVYFVDLTCGCSQMLCVGAHLAVKLVTQKIAIKCDLCGKECRRIRSIRIERFPKPW